MTPATSSYSSLTWNIEGFKQHRFSLKYFAEKVSADFIFLNECLLFQYEDENFTDILRGEYCHSLNSDDITDPELPFVKNRSNGGTMILWKRSLDPFVTVIPTETHSFLAIKFQPPMSPPSLHVSLYLPTSGKESEFVAEVTKLRIFLEEFSESQPRSLVFIRGDSNVNVNNKPRVKIFNDLKNSCNLRCVQIDHKTYHHFLGNGLFDSNIDVIMHVDDKDITEEVLNIYCKKDFPDIGSHHDIIASSFTLPRISTESTIPSFETPIIQNKRTRIVWSTEAIPVYQSLLGTSLSDLRDRWCVPDSRTSVSLLIQLSSEILSAAASSSNTSISLSEQRAPKSARVPKAIKSAQNKIRRICSTRKNLPSTDPVHVAITNKLIEARLNLRKVVRAHNGAVDAAEDKRMFSILSSSSVASSTIYRKIKSLKASTAKQISFLKVGSDEYHGDNVKTGFFTSISRLKSRPQYQNTSESETVDEYRKDYEYILQLCENKRDLPSISLALSTDILKSMKQSVNDLYSITPAHYINAGDSGIQHFNMLLNCIINDVNNASIEELNACYALLLHKGHHKPRNIDRAYRTISTCPVLSKALDLYIRHLHKDKWNACQAATQYQGEGSCHELAGLLLTELIQHSLNTSKEPFSLTPRALSTLSCLSSWSGTCTRWAWTATQLYLSTTDWSIGAQFWNGIEPLWDP